VECLNKNVDHLGSDASLPSFRGLTNPETLLNAFNRDPHCATEIGTPPDDAYSR